MSLIIVGYNIYYYGKPLRMDQN